MKPVKVFFGEGTSDACLAVPYLQDAYEAAEEFCSLGTTCKRRGIPQNPLLRRIGSTICAGRNTTEKMLTEWGHEAEIVDGSLFEEEDDQAGCHGRNFR